MEVNVLTEAVVHVDVTQVPEEVFVVVLVLADGSLVRTDVDPALADGDLVDA